MTDLPERTVEQIRKLRAHGTPWKRIQERFGISYQTARSAVDAEYRKARVKRDYRRERDSASERSTIAVDKVEKRRAWADRLDTRDLTGRVCGDPFPGRSALDARRGTGGGA